MVYDTFLNTVKEQMEQALGDGYSLTLRKVQKIMVLSWTVCALQKVTAPLLLPFI